MSADNRPTHHDRRGAAKPGAGPSEQRSLSGIEKLVTESLQGIQSLKPQATANPKIAKPVADSPTSDSQGSGKGASVGE
jgi:hypothetical protein